MLQEAYLHSEPSIIHHNVKARVPATPLILETRATKNISCKVMAAINFKQAGLYEVNFAVQYVDGDTWYPKDVRVAFNLRDALAIAYGGSRKWYKTAASRALAGLLHDSIVPATDDIDF